METGDCGDFFSDGLVRPTSAVGKRVDNLKKWRNLSEGVALVSSVVYREDTAESMPLFI